MCATLPVEKAPFASFRVRESERVGDKKDGGTENQAASITPLASLSGVYERRTQPVTYQSPANE